MKGGLIYVVLGFVFGVLTYFFLSGSLSPPMITAVFSPENGNEIIDLIDSAQTSLDIEMYVFTSRDVIEALDRAKARGVEIRIIIERNVLSGQNDETYRELAAKGFNIRYASIAYKLTHAKFMILDGKSVLVGSHNLSNSALYENREASVIIRDPVTIAKFIEIFEKDWSIAS